MVTSYIGADVDSKMTDLAVERDLEIVQRYRVPTTIPALREVLARVAGPKALAFEEGPMADWLYRNLVDCVDELVVCDPRRNALICDDGDADDVIDAGKLATLLRGKFLRPVHHSLDQDHVVLRQWVNLYHDRVRQAVREVNKLRGRCRMFGVRPRRGVLRVAKRRAAWLKDLGSSPLGPQLELLWTGYDASAAQVTRCRHRLWALTKNAEIVRLWKDLPGVGSIRAMTIYAYLETPWRFGNNPHRLWKYCGVGLERASSGKDKNGKPKVGVLKMVWRTNRRLKGALMGAVISAIRQGDNVFAEIYKRSLNYGMTPSNARHAVARKMITVMWGMWKTMTRFDPALVA